ncbi:MAG TPA: hypothetical protein ENN17_06845 [bacterium]|nr:hypothetical protein [bacterium]
MNTPSLDLRESIRRDILLTIVFLLFPVNGIPGPGPGFSTGKSGFTVRVKGEIVPYRIFALFVLPGETLIFEALAPPGRGRLILETAAGKAVSTAAGTWRWRAPEESGLVPVRIFHPQTADSMRLNIFVMVPFGRLEGEYLNGYRIGSYPAEPFKPLPVYQRPDGFVEVTGENRETRVSPHFTLEQFLCKQEGGDPRYIVLRERLLLKLELILEKVNENGYRCDTFHIMSGYRTPYYNRLIGNGRYSSHIYGGAADIFIDENPKDGLMDDLNGDGRSDHQDAAILYDIIDGMYGKPWYRRFIGGLAKYERTEFRGPFVHVDVRGVRARWGH